VILRASLSDPVKSEIQRIYYIKKNKKSSKKAVFGKIKKIKFVK